MAGGISSSRIFEKEIVQFTDGARCENERGTYYCCLEDFIYGHVISSFSNPLPVFSL